ncbi:MAG: aspartate kinase [Deltaproteobacteria bacterium]|nr:aspartate kinase [Deltaproteobacteria bacterium]
MRVLKFGGTSVGDAARIVAVCDIVASKIADDSCIVVVSAAAKMTDLLLRAGRAAAEGRDELETITTRVRQLTQALSLEDSVVVEPLNQLAKVLAEVRVLGRCSDEHFDSIAATGERVSARLVSAALCARGTPARAIDADHAGMITDERFGAAEPLPESDELLRHALAKPQGYVAVVTGFLGRTRDGRTTTLGRGGSDYSAAIIGAAVGADEIEIWTDVDGVMTADPRVEPEAVTIASLSFGEAAELAYFGAKVLHPKTIHPAIRQSIPVRVLNTFAPTRPGTVITQAGAIVDPSHPARAIAAKKNITVVQVVSSRMLLADGFLAKIFEVFARYRIVVDMVATSEVSVSLTVDREDHLGAACDELRAIGEVHVQRGRALVAVVGLGVGATVGIAGRVFSALARARVNIELISAGSGRTNMSMVVSELDADRAVRALHHALFAESA